MEPGQRLACPAMGLEAIMKKIIGFRIIQIKWNLIFFFKQKRNIHIFSKQQAFSFISLSRSIVSSNEMVQIKIRLYAPSVPSGH